MAKKFRDLRRSMRHEAQNRSHEKAQKMSQLTFQGSFRLSRARLKEICRQGAELLANASDEELNKLGEISLRSRIVISSENLEGMTVVTIYGIRFGIVPQSEIRELTKRIANGELVAPGMPKTLFPSEQALIEAIDNNQLEEMLDDEELSKLIEARKEQPDIRVDIDEL